MRLIIRNITLLTLLGITIGSLLPTTMSPIVVGASITQPEYAKWGQVAVQQTTARYHAAIIDYLHVGRHEVRAGVAEEKFKLWLRDQQREFGVFITIQFYTANDEVISVQFEEVSK